MTMDRLEHLAARAADGLATPAELDELAAGLESADEAALLREALVFEAGAVDVSDGVMGALELDDVLLSAFADGQLDPARREQVAARLSRDADARALVGAFAGISAEVREAVSLERGPAPSLWPQVARQIGVDPELVPGWDGALLAEAVRAEAGAVDVVPAVLAAVRPRERAPAAAEPSGLMRWLQSWSLPAFGLAAAAALLLSFPTSAPESDGALSFRLAPINHVQIEDISTDSADAMVQVLQFDEDAPTIIFIEEVPAGDQGATL